ncbi:MAG: hypothetical protein V4516_00360 [Pseudomonadota bacterium]
MRLFLAKAAGLACLFLAFPAASQTAQPDPKADLATIRAKADGNQYVTQLLNQISGQGNVGNAAEELVMRMLRGISRQDADLTQPFAYRDAANVQKAQFRAQAIGQILMADLDNDGNVTKDELRALLRVQQNNEAASAFFSSDADGNETLSAAEIRDTADLMLTRFGNPDDERADVARIFDFDDDGVLTKEELERGKTALGM